MKALSIMALTWACVMASAATDAEASSLTVSVVRDGTAHRYLYGIAFRNDGLNGASVGARGLLLTTSDGGKSWRARQLDTRARSLEVARLALTSVAIKENDWLTVGQHGLIFRSTNGGEDWSRIDSPTNERLLGVDINRHGLAVAVGSFGTILLSRDGGATWRKSSFNAAELVPGGYEPHFYDVQVDDDGTVLMVGEFSMILRSKDGGASWNQVHKGDPSLFRLHMRADGVGFVAGQRGTVLHTADHGRTWTELDTGVDSNLLDVYATSGGTVIVPGMRHMLVSEDGGATWAEVHAGDVDRNWYSAVGRGADGVYAIGHTGRVIRIGKKSKKINNQGINGH